MDKKAHDAPWTGWIGRQMPDNLLNAYLRAKDLSKERDTTRPLDISIPPWRSTRRICTSGWRSPAFKTSSALRLDALYVYHRVESSPISGSRWPGGHGRVDTIGVL